MRLFEEQLVYCIDKESPLYGRWLKVDVVSENDSPLFSELRTGEVVRINANQVSDQPPPKEEIGLAL
jgi:hypothetical protein